jgi:hypothetical protein
MRDSRINLIIEGTSQIMRLFIAREALDAHMRIVSQLMDPHQSPARKVGAALQAFRYYAIWYPKQWLSWCWWPRHAELGPTLSTHMRFVERTSHQLARFLFHSAMRYQTKLAYRQQLLARLVDIGSDLFVMAASCSKAHALLRVRPSDQSPVDLADLFCRIARRRIQQAMWALKHNNDRGSCRLAQDVMSGRMEWLEEGIL